MSQDREPPTVPSFRPRGAVRREETTRRHGGIGDNWQMSWAADGRQVATMCDGSAWESPPRYHYNSLALNVEGGAENPRFEVVAGYPELVFDPREPRTWNRYYAFATFALDGRIYQFLSTPSAPFDAADTDLPRHIGAKLIYSPDDGETWCNQDGSTPVVWEDWDERSPKSMAFFEEPGEAFSLLTFLQMGRNYEANTDGYVYVYSPNGNTEGTMNQLVMFRVPKDLILEREAYEFFAGLDPQGEATWSKEIGDRGVVHTFPSGWVNVDLHPYAWHPSVVYIEPLGLYLMVNWGTGCTPEGEWFGKPSYLGLWIAEQPWGPWEQIHEETAWTPEGDAASRAYEPQIPPGWIAEDGKSFWLVWSDYKDISGELLPPLETWEDPNERNRVLTGIAERMPNYAFNVQRVDLVP
jgi:hypothetical protein